MVSRARLYAVVIAGMMTLSSCGSSSSPKTSSNSPKTNKSSNTTSSTTTSSPPSSSTTTPSSTTTTVTPNTGTALNRLPAPNGFEPSSVTFVSQSDGFVLGTTKSCNTTACASIVTTTNNGASWQQMPSPPAPFLSRSSALGSSVGISQIRFANVDNGWAFGPSLYATHTSGASWQQVQIPIPGKITALATAGGKVFAIVTNCTNQTSSCTSSLISSSISNNSFTQVSGVVNSGTPNTGSNGSPIVLYATPSGVNGFVLLGYQGNHPSEAFLYGTNGGNTWARFPDPCGTNLEITSLTMPNATTLDTLCSGGVAAGSSEKILMQTSNSKTQRLGNAPLPGDGGQLASPNTSTPVIATSSAASFIYRSINSGQSWTTSAQYGDGGVGFYDFGFTSPTQGIAIHGTPPTNTNNGPVVDSLIESTNAGASWFTVPIP